MRVEENRGRCRSKKEWMTVIGEDMLSKYKYGYA